jgi:hypothetical protein
VNDRNLIRAGGIAAVMAGVVFRRNLGVEIALFSAQKPAESVAGWLSLLQTQRLLGLAYLNVFDLIHYALVGLMFVTLFTAIWQQAKCRMGIALLSGGWGIAVAFATNTAFSLLAISNQYPLAETEQQRLVLEGAGQALLASSRFSSAGAQPGSGGYLSLLLVALAGMLISTAMWKSAIFNKGIAVLGMLANGLDLAYCAGLPLIPQTATATLAVVFIPAAGLFYMLWHILIGWKLIRFSKTLP